MKLKVRTGFSSDGRYWKPGDVYTPKTKQEEQHLLQTKQCTPEIYGFGKRKQEKAQIKTKEEKAVVETKSNKESLQERYEELTGERPDKRWSEKRLQEEIDDQL